MKLRSRVGGVMRDVERQLGGLTQPSRAALEEQMSRTKRILSRKRKDKNKLYVLHAPEVEFQGRQSSWRIVRMRSGS